MATAKAGPSPAGRPSPFVWPVVVLAAIVGLPGICIAGTAVAAAEGAGAAPSEGDRGLLLYTLLFTLLLIGLFAMAVAWALLRAGRRRAAAKAHAQGEPPADPWSEAGKRAKPIEPDPDLPRDDSEDDTRA